jgi:beta-lactamase regulating signal transducer with metallopeptidase domain
VSDIESQVLNLAKKLKLRRKVRVNIVDAEFGPAVIGLVRPTIVLPNSIVAGKTAEELEPILGHELIHLRRGDIYWAVLQVIACSLMWFNPLVWLASRNVTRESEKCCDEETIANFQCDRANYARVLVDILEQKSRLRIAPVAPGVRPADITSSRLERIMQSENGTCRRTPRWIWALTLLIAIVVLPGAAMVRSQESNRPEPATRTTNGSTSVDIVSPNTPAIRNRTIYLGLSANAIKDLQKYGSVTSPIPNGSIDRIVISDRNIPKSGRVKLIQPSILRISS